VQTAISGVREHDRIDEFGHAPAALRVIDVAGEVRDDDRDELVELAVPTGALMLSRATSEDELSERILAAAKDFLTS